MTAMNVFDIGVVILLVIGLGIGLARGLVRILIGILTLVVAFFLASRYQDQVTAVLTSHHVSQTPARIGAYIVVFLATMLAGGLVAFVVGKILKLAMLSFPDRLAGGALGIVAALLAAAFVVHPLVASSPNGSQLLATSKTAPYVSVVADLGNAAAPDAVAKRYESGIDALRRIWRGDEPLPVDKVKKALNSALESGEKAVDEVKKKVAPDPKKKN
jgi:membrane protein required for colicin V production